MTLPFASVSALLLYPLRRPSQVEADTPHVGEIWAKVGSVVCLNPAKYTTPLSTFVTLPMSLGILPTTTGFPAWFVMVLTPFVEVPPVVMTTGAPLTKFIMPPTCHLPTIVCSQPGAFDKY